ncbi:MAG: diguanylate cyclase [Chloroflexota bacterium]|nr:diguanylate cyclase [Chloroflexota bacterium]
MKILIVFPDTRSGRRLLARLEADGYDVVQTIDAKDASKHLQEELPQVVILDFDLAGADFVPKIRQNNINGYIYIIGMTSSSDVRSSSESSKLLVDEFIIKPVEPDELIARLAVVDRYITTLMNIRSREDAPEPLRDVVTGTFSQTTIEEMLEIEISRSKRMRSPFSLALIEICEIEALREHHGQEVVDSALAQVALKIWASVRTYDFVGRWGDNGFMLVLPETPIHGASIVANRVRRNVNSVPLSLAQEDSMRLNVNIGVVKYNPSSSVPLHDFIDSVDWATARIDNR